MNAIAARVSKNEEALQKYGVELYDASGAMKSTYDVLTELSPAWEKMTDAERVALGQTLAGTNQYKVLSPVMSQMSVVQKTYQEALQSTGYTEQQNAIYMESLEARLTALRTEFEKLVLGKGGLQNLAKTIVDLGIKILKFANSDIGRLAIVTALIVTSISLASKALTAFGSTSLGVSVQLVALTASEIGFKAALDLVTESVIRLTTAMLTNPLFIAGAVVATIGASILIIEKWNNRLEDSVNKLNELAEQSDQTDAEIESMSKALEDIRQRMEDIEEQKMTITDEAQKELLESELGQLQLQGDELERQIALLKLRQEIEHKEEEEQAKKTARTTSTSKYGISAEESAMIPYVGMGDTTGLATASYVNQISQATPQEEMRAIIDTYTTLNAKVVEQREVVKSLIDENGKAKEGFEEQNATLQAMEDELAQVVKDGTNTSETLFSIANSIYSTDEASQELKDSCNALGDEFLQVTNTGEDSKDAIDGVVDSEEELDEDIQTTTDALSEQLNLLDSLATDYNKLKKAVDDYNSGEGITANNLKALIELSQQYSGVLSIENGQLVLNTQYFENQTQEIINNQKALVMETAMEKLLALEQNKTTTATQSQTTSVGNNTTALDEETLALKRNTVEQTANRIARNDKSKGTEASRIVDEMNAELAVLNQLGSSVDTLYKDKETSSKSSAKNSKDAWLEAYKEEKDALENLYKTNQISSEEYYTRLYALGQKYFQDTAAHQKKYAKEWREVEEDTYKGLQDTLKELISQQKEQFKEAISSLKEQKTAAVDGLKAAKKAAVSEVESQIKSLKRAKDAAKEFWDSKINALKEQNKKLDEQNKLMEYQQALAEAKAKKVLIFGESGQWEYGQDEAAVSQAEEELAQYEKELAYERELEALENSRDAELKVYEQKIQDLEDYKDYLTDYYDRRIEETEAYYDAQIKAAEKNLEQFEKNAEAMLKAQDSQANAEGQVWQTRLKNLANFINQYNAMLSKLGKEGVSVSPSYKAIGSVSASAFAKHADGVDRIKDDEIAIVGEDPNKEIVLGSKINNGVQMGLAKGSGVVNAASTKTLAGLFNQLGKYASNGFGAGNYSTTNQSSNQSTNINISNISLPSVNNGEQFVDYLQNFNLSMIQKSYA